ncbi:MAG: cytochrome P450 [Myxococcales bacterium]|nr:cytochrome P450 [Myxococcales bacterium]
MSECSVYRGADDGATTESEPPMSATALLPARTYELAPAPPRLIGDPVLGNIRAVMRDTLGFLVKAQTEHGDVVRCDFGPMVAHLVSSPSGVRHVLQDNHRAYDKQTRGYLKLRGLLGQGLLTSEGDFWKRQRRIAQPAFHREHLASFADRFVIEGEAQLETWAKPETWAQTGPGSTAKRDLSADMMAVTMRIVGHTLLSTDVSDDAATVGHALHVVLEEMNKRIHQPFGFVEWLPVPRTIRYLRAKRALDLIVMRLISERRQRLERTPSEAPVDLLTMLMSMRDADTGEGMTDRQLRDEVLTLFLAGHETTANALTWTYFHLAQNPAVLTRLRAEVDSLLGDRRPTLQDVPRLSYAKAVLQESMRLHPPAWLIGRRALEPDVIDGYRVPKGSLVLLSPYVVHRHPAHWPASETFDPSRFLDGRAPEPKSFQYFPFGGGPRVCIGTQFAMMEATLLLSLFVRGVDISLAVAPEAVKLEPLITLRPKGGLPVTLKRREHPAR